MRVSRPCATRAVHGFLGIPLRDPGHRSQVGGTFVYARAVPRRFALLLFLVACHRPGPPPPTDLHDGPRPQVVRPTDRIAIDSEELRGIGELLASWLGLAGVDVTIEPRAIALRGTPGPRDVRADVPATTEDEAYALDAGGTTSTIRAHGYGGFFYGAQTLAQLAGARRIGSLAPRGSTWTVPVTTITDAPRFRYRAMHLDVARHFFGRDDVLRYVDLLAFYRYNVFHWHLTDDQGFRLPSRSHAEIDRGAGNGPTYDEADIATVVAYAAARGVTVIPELEIPGHARAILAAHPELSCTGKAQEVPHVGGIFEDVLCAGNPGSTALVDDLLADVTRLFPSHWIHIGGDEVPLQRWAACPKCQAAAKKAGASVEGLEGLFLQHAAQTLARLGRRTMVWDEALGATEANTPSPDAIIVAWQSKERGLEAARRGHDVVMAPYDFTYFNTHQSRTGAEPGQDGYLPWTQVAKLELGDEDTNVAARVLGGEGALWTEHVERRDQIETLVLPRMAVLAEVLWSSGVTPGLAARFTRQRPALDASGVAYFVDGPEGLAPRHVFLEHTTTTLVLAPPALFPDAIVRYTRDGTEPNGASPLFSGPLTIDVTTTIAAAAFVPGGRRSPTIHGTLVAERAPRGIEVATAPGARVSYYEGHFKVLPDTARLLPKATVVSSIDLASVDRALGGELRADHFALVFDGMIRVPDEGVYRFVATADDGVRVTIDGTPVLEDDGNHAARESVGEIALGAGLHGIRVAYFQGSEGKTLRLELEGVDGARKRTPVDVVRAQP